MTTPVQQPQPSPQSVRMIHAPMVLGVIMFAIVARFAFVPRVRPGGGLVSLLPVLIGVSLAGCVLGILLSYRVPRALNGESGQSFWMRAWRNAIISWALLEGAALLAVVVYSQTASRAAIAVAVLIIIVFALLNPGYFERRN